MTQVMIFRTKAHGQLAYRYGEIMMSVAVRMTITGQIPAGAEHCAA